MTVLTDQALRVQPLTVEELPLCVPHGQAFHTEWNLEPMEGPFAPDIFLLNWRGFLATMPADILGLWHGDELIGGIGVLMSQNLNTGRLLAAELFLYVEPDHRHGTGLLRLLRAFKAWGRERGARMFQIEHLLSPYETPKAIKLARVYQKLGFQPRSVGWECREG